MKYWLASIAALCSSLSIAASDTECDRQCLSGFADQLVTSMINHAPDTGRSYRLDGFSLWRTVEGIEGVRHEVIDVEAGQLFFLVVLKETGGRGILKTRMKVDQGEISELEMYVSRDPIDTGEHFNPDGIAEMPSMWWQAVAEDQTASRDELIRVGKGAFDTSIPLSYEPGCYHYEEGDRVGTIECAAPPNRPEDENVRTPVIDETLGIVVSIADVDGAILGRGSFVPTTMLAELFEILEGKGDREPPPDHQDILQVTQQTLNVIQLTKVANGKVQGTQAYMNAQGPGARSAWLP